MKHFTIETMEKSKILLQLQIEGASRVELKTMLEGVNITGYAFPNGHSLEAAWQFRLNMSNGDCIEFSSVCTKIDGWQEIGSIKLKLILMGDPDPDASIFISTPVRPVAIEALNCLVYEDSDVRAECGLVFEGAAGFELIVVAGVSPGSVTVQAPFSDHVAKPEFTFSQYQRMQI